jgi:hypothetical protein
VRRPTNYQWTHALLKSLTQQAAPTATAGAAAYAAHALLAALDIDLIEELLATGRTREQIRRAQAAPATAVFARPQ